VTPAEYRVAARVERETLERVAETFRLVSSMVAGMDSEGLVRMMCDSLTDTFRNFPRDYPEAVA